MFLKEGGFGVNNMWDKVKISKCHVSPGGQIKGLGGGVLGWVCEAYLQVLGV